MCYQGGSCLIFQRMYKKEVHDAIEWNGNCALQIKIERNGHSTPSCLFLCKTNQWSMNLLQWLWWFVVCYGLLFPSPLCTGGAAILNVSTHLLDYVQ